MTVQLKLTRLPHLNDTIVIKQEGGKYFIASPDSIIIDKEGLLRLIYELTKAQYIQAEDLGEIVQRILYLQSTGKEWITEYA